MKLSIALTSTFIIAILSFGDFFSEWTDFRSSSLEKVLEITAQTQGKKRPVEAKATITINEQVIALEVAKTAEQQRIGLMYRESLADNRGMLFIFEPARPVRFWMKNVNFPLDMIFLFNGEVKQIITNVPPCQEDPCSTYGPTLNTDIDMVIELRGGRATQLGINLGDYIPIDFVTSS
ncbi:DUF192 domain-containing protein [Cyanobacterium sp. uoEpiScrs1]|uniref:DUF192 domain-containing protein n=1 Tax=Cyanobacterium sp. uoEpiScrs1 TaxID=2976343 RepID=UPI00226A4486|nr:DUF192 domain-containing protein [Cyanobacterium sp. uoEpiScrs1]